MTDRFAAFAHSSYRRYFISRFLNAFAGQILSVAVAWQIYDQTGNAAYLGLIGLVQFLPSLLLVLVTGLASDVYGRRRVMGLSTIANFVCAAIILIIAITGAFDPIAVISVLALYGTGRAFFGPAANSLVVNVVPREDFANAISWNSSSWTLAAIIGPAIGGFLIFLSEPIAYACAALLFALSSALIFTIPKPSQKPIKEESKLKTILGGFRYIWKEKMVLGAISLDLFAVLLGGATALLPVYAKDVLEIGETGFGWLRAAPGIGAMLMVFVITSMRIRENAGLILFSCVGLFGICTVVFGYSTITWLSVLALVALGAFDMISVYVRQTLLQLWTPDDVRGRVNAVSSIFVGASNQLGEARAGFMAAKWGAIFTVVAGGYAAIGVTAVWAIMFPKLRKAKSLEDSPHI